LFLFCFWKLKYTCKNWMIWWAISGSDCIICLSTSWASSLTLPVVQFRNSWNMGFRRLEP
jgi:hypothetical protein